MTNIGFVLYKKSGPGVLTAEWSHAQDGHGSGTASGGPAKGFAGCYRIRYFDERGDLQAERDLEIWKEGDCYRLLWLHKGKITAEGIGRKTKEGLAAGYHNIMEKNEEK